MSGFTSLVAHSPALLCSSFHHASLLRSKKSSITKVNGRQRLAKCNLIQHDLHDVHITRRSADYQPNAWNYDFLGSVQTHDFKEEKYGALRDKLIREVKDLFNDSFMDTLSRLELVDAIDRLGLKRHFQAKLKNCVKSVYCNELKPNEEDLHATSLRFRILRQYGYAISEDVLSKFKDQEGKIRQEHSKDVRGLLSLYEASFLECGEDYTLEEISEGIVSFDKSCNY